MHEAPPVEHEPPPNHKPLTKNQEPKKKTFDAKASLVSIGVDDQVADDWLRVRKAKDLPLTQTALRGVISEAAKAKMTVPAAIEKAAREGWAGFKASWIDNLNQQPKQADPFRGAL